MSAKEKPKLVYPRYSPDELTAADLQTEIDNRQAADNVLSAAISTGDSSLSTALNSKLSLSGGTLTGTLGGTTAYFNSLKINTTNSAYDVEIGGSLRATSWLRTVGATGWYSETYGGGIYMQNSNYVEVYNSKKFKVNNNLEVSGKLIISGITTDSTSYLLGYSTSSKEITYQSTSTLSVNYATSAGSCSTSTTTTYLYEGNTDSNIYANNLAPSEIWLVSNIDYTVCVNYATNSFNTVNLDGVAASNYALKTGTLSNSGGTVYGVVGTTDKLYLSGITNKFSTNNVYYDSDTKEITYGTDAYSAITFVTGLTFDCSTGLKKKVNATASFTLTLSNYVSGMAGTLKVNLNGTYTITIAATPTPLKNGTFTSLTSGNYLIQWWYDGTNAFYSILKYT